MHKHAPSITIFLLFFHEILFSCIFITFHQDDGIYVVIGFDMEVQPLDNGRRLCSKWF